MEIQVELETLRREVAELRTGLQNVETRHDGKEEDAAWEAMSHRMKAEMEKNNKTASVGVQRNVVYIQSPNNNNTFGSEHVFGDVSKLPAEDKLIDFCAALNNPVGLRAMYAIFKGVYEGRWLSMNRADLVAALAISDSDLEQALRPPIASGMLRWGKHADGTEYFEMERPDLFAVLLTFV